MKEKNGFILEAKNIKKTFITGDSKVEALKGISFCLKKGEMLAVMGGSGSGKSTLLNVLGALLIPDDGEIWLNGKKEEQYSEEPHATEIRNRHIGFIFQDFSLLNDLSVRENVSLPLILKGEKEKKTEGIVKDIVMSAIDIEKVVGKLMEELGVGGFMGVQDVKHGMKISISDVNGAKKEYTGEVTDRNGNDIYVTIENEAGDIFENRERHKNNICKLNIVVDNVLYCWSDIVIQRSKPGENGQFKLHIETNPQVYNRRKYPCMPITNTCTVKFEGEDKTYQGHMVNISANGFAISIFDSVFADAREKNIVVSVDDFDEISAHPLEGCIIRSSNNDGEYIVGCRMPEDVQSIKNYVSKNYCN